MTTYIVKVNGEPVIVTESKKQADFFLKYYGKKASLEIFKE